jgi:hypothetical protein
VRVLHPRVPGDAGVHVLLDEGARRVVERAELVLEPLRDDPVRDQGLLDRAACVRALRDALGLEEGLELPGEGVGRVAAGAPAPAHAVLAVAAAGAGQTGSPDVLVGEAHAERAPLAVEVPALVRRHLADVVAGVRPSFGVDGLDDGHAFLS